MKSNLIFQFLFCCLAMTTGAWAQNLQTTIGLASTATPITLVSPSTYSVPSGTVFTVVVGAATSNGVTVSNATLRVPLPAGIEVSLTNGYTSATLTNASPNTPIAPASQGGILYMNGGNRYIEWPLASVSPSASISVTITALFPNAITCNGASALFSSTFSATGQTTATSNPNLTMVARARNHWAITKSSNASDDPTDITNPYHYIASVNPTPNGMTRVQYIISLSNSNADGDGDYDVPNYRLRDQFPTGAVAVALEVQRGNSSSVTPWYPVNSSISWGQGTSLLSYVHSPTTPTINAGSLGFMDLSIGYNGFYAYRVTVDYPNSTYNTTMNTPLLNTATLDNMQLTTNNCTPTANDLPATRTSNQTIVDLIQATHNGVFSKTAVSPSAVGCRASYALNFVNNGTEPITLPMEFVDALPPGFIMDQFYTVGHSTNTTMECAFNQAGVANPTYTAASVNINGPYFNIASPSGGTHLRIRVLSTTNSVIVAPGATFAIQIGGTLASGLTPGSTLQNCATMSYTNPANNQTTNLGSSCASIIVPAATPAIHLEKSICTTNNQYYVYSPNQIITYVLTFANYDNNAVLPAGATLTDLLPNDVEYIANSARMYDPAQPGASTCTVANNPILPVSNSTWLLSDQPTVSPPDNNGRVRLTWTTNDAIPVSTCNITPYYYREVRFKVRIKQNSATEVRNGMTYTNTNITPTFTRTTALNREAIFYVARRDSMVITKQISSDNGATWSSGTVNANAGANVKYRIKLENLGNAPVSGIKLYDRLPQIDDRRLINCAVRNSAFGLTNATNFVSTLQASPTATATSLTPTIGSMNITGCPGATNLCALSAFSAPVSTDNLFRADFSTLTMQPGEIITTTFDATIPANTAGGLVANNSAAVCFGGSVLPPTESNEVGVRTNCTFVTNVAATANCFNANFSATTTGCTGVNPPAYTWSFGSAGATATQTYAVGTYTVTVTTNCNGCSATTTASVTVTGQANTANSTGANWFFGENAGLKFNGSATPVALTGSAMNTEEGCATLSDANGNLLFYTNGIGIWNASHTQINTTALTGDPSSTQSGVIVPKPGSSTNYYVIYQTNQQGGIMRYAEVAVNAGVVTMVSQNTALTTTAVAAKIEVIKKPNSNDSWLIMADGTNIIVRAITNAGIALTGGATTVPSAHIGAVVVNSTYGRNIGYMRANAAGTRLALANINTNTDAVLELYDFDPTTGAVGSQKVFKGSTTATPNKYQNTYGVAFSPNDRFLYFTNFGGGTTAALYQMDLNAGSTVSALDASVTTISTGTVPLEYGAVQVAPNGKIYMAVSLNSASGSVGPHIARSALSVINAPNAAGAACNFVFDGQSVAPGKSRSGLPNTPTFMSVVQPCTPMVVTATATAGCIGSTINLTSGVTPALGTSGTYSWTGPNGFASSAQNPSITGATAAMSGTYTVIVNDGTGATASATATITIAPCCIIQSVTITGAPFCAGACTALTANVMPANATYTYAWGANLGSANQADACEDGIYAVTVTDANGCTATATFTTTRLAAPTAAITGPTTICPNTTITLTATGGGTYNWGGGITTATRTVSAVGVYTVTVTSANGCTATASYTVSAATNCCTFTVTDMRYTLYSNFRVLGFNTPTTSGAVAGSTITYAWDFGDGTTATTANPSKTYNSAGVYTVCLTATATAPNGQVCSYRCCRTVNIGDPCASTNATFNYTCNTSNGAYTFVGIPNTGFASVFVITNTSGQVVATSPVVVAANNNFTHNYTYSAAALPAGTYNVCRTVTRTMNATNGVYCETKFCRTIIVAPSTCTASARFTALTRTATPLIVTLSSVSSVAATSQEWSVATTLNGAYSGIGTSATFNYTLANYGTYWIKLVINKGTNCEATVIHRLEINQPSCAPVVGTVARMMDNTTQVLTSETTLVSGFESKNEPTVQPNPTNGVFNLMLNRLSEHDVTINIVNLQGTLLDTQKTYIGTANLDIDLSKYPSGLYLITMLTANGERVTQKVVKE
jgi:uncharacterized repeat protein (TIGR01451 family)